MTSTFSESVQGLCTEERENQRQLCSKEMGPSVLVFYFFDSKSTSLAISLFQFTSFQFIVADLDGPEH